MCFWNVNNLSGAKNVGISIRVVGKQHEATYVQPAEAKLLFITGLDPKEQYEVFATVVYRDKGTTDTLQMAEFRRWNMTTLAEEGG